MKDDDRYEFDFSPLDNVHNATENPNITSIMRDRLTDPETQVMVLTARAPISIDDIHRVLRSFEDPIQTDNIIMIGVEGGNKGEYIKNAILSKYNNIRDVEFYDDSDINITNVNQVKKDLLSSEQLDNFDVYLVKNGMPKKER